MTLLLPLWEKFDVTGFERGKIMASKQTKKSGKGKKRKNKTGRIFLFIAEIVILIVLLLVLYAVLKTDKVEKINIKEENIVVNEQVAENESMKGYRNIALFGVDSRDKTLGKGNRSDTIMVASINQDTGDVKLISVYRDTYMNLGNDSYNKCNAAYAKGGPEQAINMLNMNLDLNITDYVTIGFTGLIEVIDALGGVEMEVTEAEIVHLNNYQISMVGTTTDGKTFVATEGKDYTAVTTPGVQKLNGLQATAYCRIRYVGDDYQRTERQRNVLTAVLEKAKKADVSTLNKILNEALDNVSTSLDVDEMVAVMSELTKYNIVVKDGFPFEEYRSSGNVGAKGSCVIPADLTSNVKKLHGILFDQPDYEVSGEVQSYSQIIHNDTGK